MLGGGGGAAPRRRAQGAGGGGGGGGGGPAVTAHQLFAYGFVDAEHGGTCLTVSGERNLANPIKGERGGGSPRLHHL